MTPGMGKKLLKVPSLVANSLILLPITYIPGWFGNKLRCLYYKMRCKHLGKKVRIDVGAIIGNPEWVSIGDNTWIDKHCMLTAGKIEFDSLPNKRFIKNENFKFNCGELIIGNNVHVAPFVVLQAHGGLSIGNNCGIGAFSAIYTLSNHYLDPGNRSNTEIYFTARPPASNQYLVMGPVVIQDNVGIAHHSFVYCGVTIEKSSFIKAFSEVISHIPQNTVYGYEGKQTFKERFRGG